MTRLMNWRTALGAGALLLIATATAACGTAAANASPATTSSGTTTARTTTTEPTTTTAATTLPTTTTTRPVGTGAPAPIIYTCEGHAVVRPSSLVVACADAGMALVGLQWTNWGAATAYATGTLQEKQCIPACASNGNIDTYRASVSVSGLTNGHYTGIHIIAPPAPNQPYDLPLSRAGS